MFLLLEIVFSIIIGALIILYINQLRRYKALEPIKGPSLLLPIFGHLLEMKHKPEDLYEDFDRTVKENGKLFQVCLGPFLQYVIVIEPAIVEKVLSSSKEIQKPDFYDFLVKWLGRGLLTNSGESYRKHRKLLTPAFHFTILEQAVETFNNASKILIEKLRSHVDGDVFDVYPYLTLFGLDVIYETAMGININVQTQSDSEYVQAVRDVCDITFRRPFYVLEQIDFYFDTFSSLGRKYNKALKILHGTADAVIKEKRRLLLENNTKESSNVKDSVDRKKPMAFLDVLLTSTIDGKPLTDIEIRDEVNTIMFEGHDTVSSGASFTLFLLSRHPQIQAKVFNEVREVIGDDKSKVLTIADLNAMKYLEAVIKESMRLYPPIPFIGRQLVEDLHFDDTIIPKNTPIIILIHWLHRLQEIFPEPNTFKPERFLDGHNDRNFFSFIPFGAGVRNCIGQKYAMYEMKLIISNILRNYELLSAGPEVELKLAVAIVCKSNNGVPIKLTTRTYS